MHTTATVSRRSRGWLLALTAILVTAAGVYLFLPPEQPDIFALLPRSEKERAENPAARAAYEWTQLRDPATGTIPRGIRSAELQYARTLPVRAEKIPTSLQKGASSTWTSRGPINQGGRTRALAIDVTNENIILAGGVSGGMWRSTDAGATWTRTTSLSDSIQSVTCIAQDTRSGFEHIWYYGTGERIGNSASGADPSDYRGDGIFRSTDGGQTWERLASTSTSIPQTFENLFDFVWTIGVSPVDGSVYAATYGAIHKSTDQGATWARILGGSGSPYSNFVDLTVTSTGVVYATFSSEGNNAGIYRSSDGGANWATITPGGWPSTYRRVVLAHAPSNENAVYFLAETPGSGSLNTEDNSEYWTSLWKYTYVSGDGTGAGGTWDDRSSNIPQLGGDVGNFNHQNSYNLDISVKPDDEHMVLLGATNLYRSTDGYASTSNSAWIGGYSTINDISQYENHHPDQHSLVFLASDPTVVYSGHDGGISRTENILADSVAWALKNTGYVTSQFYSVALNKAVPGDPILIGGLQDNGHLATGSTDGNFPWSSLPLGGDGGVTAITPSGTSWYISTQNGNVARLVLDNQNNLVDLAVVQPSGGSNFMFVTPYVIDPNDETRMFLAAGDRLWRNSDLTGVPTATQVGDPAYGATSVNWTEMTNSALPGDAVSAIGISTAETGRVYYGSAGGAVYRIDNAESGDPTPTNVSSASFSSGAYVSALAVNPRNADTVIAVFSNYSVKSLFLTTDGGSTWTDIGGNLEENADGSGIGPSCRWATILPMGNEVRFYVATTVGVYSTNLLNGSSTVWEQEGAGTIGNVVVTMIESRMGDNVVVAATHANGIFSTTAVTTSVEEYASQTPESYGLEANYPNPFNPSTTIGFTIREAGPVELTIFDASGRRIASLIDSDMPSGRHETIWNGRTSSGRSVASGTYFYRLEAPGIQQTKKMTLLK